MSLTISGVRSYWPVLNEVIDWIVPDEVAETVGSALVTPAAAGCASTLTHQASVTPQLIQETATPPQTSPAPVQTSPAPVQISPTPPAPPPAPIALITWAPTLIQEMDSHNSANWQMASWSNGNPFNDTWQPNNISFNQGIMSLILDNVGCPGSCDGKPYASGEYRTKQGIYGYGYYEARMRAAEGSGLVSSFFTYTGVYGQASHHEIDFEVLGKNCNEVQTNYYVEGRGNHEEMIDLGFNACQEFHNYGLEWTEKYLIFYVDGREVRRANEDPSTPERDIPFKPGKIMVNLWPGIGVDDWLGSFSYSGPLRAEYDWIKYSSLDAAAQPPISVQTTQPSVATPLPTPSTTQPTTAATAIVTSAAPTDPLPVQSIQQGSFVINGGSVALLPGGIYQFSAGQDRDPGFGISTGDYDLAGRNTLKFEIRGSIQRHGAYGRFIAQVYNQTDDEYVPAVSLDPVLFGNDFITVTIDLEGQISKAKKVQFLLITDSGSCQVEIGNIRFE